MERKYEKKGSFTLTQPIMLVSDPCYNIDEWCTHPVSNCKIGKWTVYTVRKNYPYELDGETKDDIRNAMLFAVHESRKSITFLDTIQWIKDYIKYKTGWENGSDNIGVDSGQAGFFDYSKYGDNTQFEKMGKCGFGDKWYSNCCDNTLNESGAGIVADCGAVSSSGFGDGCYTVWKHLSSDGEVDALALFFLPDVEDDDEVAI